MAVPIAAAKGAVAWPIAAAAARAARPSAAAGRRWGRDEVQLSLSLLSICFFERMSVGEYKGGVGGGGEGNEKGERTEEAPRARDATMAAAMRAMETKAEELRRLESELRPLISLRALTSSSMGVDGESAEGAGRNDGGGDAGDGDEGGGAASAGVRAAAPHQPQGIDIFFYDVMLSSISESPRRREED